MEKAIEVLEESLKRVLANIEEQQEEHAEECEFRDKLCAEIAEKERLVDEIAQALPHVTGAPELVLKERLKRADQRIEDARKHVVRVNERIKDLEESNKCSLEKVKEYEYSIARLKGEAAKSFPTIEDFLKWLYGDKAVKEYKCPHNHTQQMAVVDGTITFCTDCRKELVEPSI